MKKLSILLLTIVLGLSSCHVVYVMSFTDVLIMLLVIAIIFWYGKYRLIQRK